MEGLDEGMRRRVYELGFPAQLVPDSKARIASNVVGRNDGNTNNNFLLKWFTHTPTKLAALKHLPSMRSISVGSQQKLRSCTCAKNGWNTEIVIVIIIVLVILVISRVITVIVVIIKGVRTIMNVKPWLSTPHPPKFRRLLLPKALDLAELLLMPGGL